MARMIGSMALLSATLLVPGLAAQKEPCKLRYQTSPGMESTYRGTWITSSEVYPRGGKARPAKQKLILLWHDKTLPPTKNKPLARERSYRQLFFQTKSPLFTYIYDSRKPIRKADTLAQLLKGMLNQPFQVTYSPRGPLIGSAEFDHVLQTAKKAQPGNSWSALYMAMVTRTFTPEPTTSPLALAFIKLPTEAVKAKSQWSTREKLEIPVAQPLGTLRCNATTKYTVLGQVRVGKILCLEIKAKITLEPLTSLAKSVHQVYRPILEKTRVQAKLHFDHQGGQLIKQELDLSFKLKCYKVDQAIKVPNPKAINKKSLLFRQTYQLGLKIERQ